MDNLLLCLSTTNDNKYKFYIYDPDNYADFFPQESKLTVYYYLKDNKDSFTKYHLHQDLYYGFCTYKFLIDSYNSKYISEYMFSSNKEQFTGLSITGESNYINLIRPNLFYISSILHTIKDKNIVLSSIYMSSITKQASYGKSFSISLGQFICKL